MSRHAVVNDVLECALLLHRGSAPRCPCLIRNSFAMLAGLLVSAQMVAQSAQIGNLPSAANLPVGGPAPVTLLDFVSHPTASGNPTSAVFDSATFEYSAFPCPAAVKIKFFRIFGVAARFLGERGPFDVTQKVQTVSLFPPVALQSSDWIAIAKLTDCGSPLADSKGTGALASFAGDIQGDIIFGNLQQGVTLALTASGLTTPFDGISAAIPVVYEGPGASGAFFRTEARLSNPSDSPVSGWLRYQIPRLTGPNDPEGVIQYALGGWQTLALDLKSTSGTLPLESLDIIPTTGTSPFASVRLFNDLGATGTAGFSTSDVQLGDCLGTGDRGVLIGPMDPVNYRWNIGFRGFPSADLSITVRSADGSVLATRNLGARLLYQASAQSILGVEILPSMSVTFEVTSGRALVYGITADNRTNDTEFQLARRVPVSP